jgi:deoxyribonuclease-4
MPKIGFHAPIKGGVHNALIVAKDTGCDTVQLFSRNPRGWMAKPLKDLTGTNPLQLSGEPRRCR